METTLKCVEVMRTLRVSRETVHRMLNSGELKGFRRGRVIRIDRGSVDRLLGRGRTEGRSEA